MENKYYTPELSEFHVGFKYELKCLNTIDYNTRIYGDKVDTPLLNSDESIFESIGEELEDRDIRVKYLDKEDILSVGFAPHTFFEYKKDNYYIGLGITQPGEEVNREITVRRSRGDNDIIFRGTIKNLSELKVILKQLGIDE